MIEAVMQDNVNGQMARLTEFRHLLDQIFQDALGFHNGSARSTLLLASMLKVEQSARAVEVLASAGCVEEIQSISRTLVEVTVNAAYLQYANQKETERFLQFHPESVQQYGMPGQRGGRTVSGEIMRRLGGLVTPNGKNADPNWSSMSLLDRARFSDEVSNIPVMTLLVQRCYGRGHAAVHGTIGALDTFVQEVNMMQATRVETRLAALNEALFSVNLCFLTLCMYLNGHFGLRMDHAIGLAASSDSRTPQSALTRG